MLESITLTDPSSRRPLVNVTDTLGTVGRAFTRDRRRNIDMSIDDLGQRGELNEYFRYGQCIAFPLDSSKYSDISNSAVRWHVQCLAPPPTVPHVGLAR